MNFYENNRKIIRKSVYYRKYHVKNIINKISIYIYIHQIFKEIEKVLPQVNGNRKRVINTNFILKQLLKMFNLPHENISISKLKRTLAFCEQYCDNILSLIGDTIELIINR